MARIRKYGEDLTYSEWHRAGLPELYGRIGHRLDMADRDFTEFCSFCKEPLMIYELVRDVGQNLYDKATTVTRRLAARSHLSAALVAYRVDRSPSIQDEIDDLNHRLRCLEQRSNITHVAIRPLYPHLEKFLDLSPREWADWLLISHRQHHDRCRVAHEFPVHRERFQRAQWAHVLHRPSLFDGIR